MGHRSLSNTVYNKEQKKMILQKIRNNKGFSLIELLGVLIILGVLFALVVPHVIDFDSNAKGVSENYEGKAQERLDVFKQYGGKDNLFEKKE